MSDKYLRRLDFLIIVCLMYVSNAKKGMGTEIISCAQKRHHCFFDEYYHHPGKKSKGETSLVKLTTASDVYPGGVC